MYFDDFFMMLIFIAVALAFIGMIRRAMSSKNTSSSSSSSSSTSSKPQNVSTAKIAEDIKATKTSQVSDVVSILDDLGSTSSNYRHYCELIGNSMGSSNIIAPYSKRAVAYYDIKCYRLDATLDGGQRETLVAHEHSFDPFFFTDASCDTPVYVDLESFGNNVILVNSTNHIEGPNSDFAKAFEKNAVSATSSGTALAMVGHAVQAGSNVLLGATEALRRALGQAPTLQPAFALAGGAPMKVDDAPKQHRHIKFAGRGGGQRPSGNPGTHAPSGASKSGPQRGTTMQLGNTTIYVNTNMRPTRPPEHLGDFMGGYGGGPWVMGGGPGYYHHRPTTNSADVILGMGLGALLNSMTTVSQQTVTSTSPTNTFRGYRLVENIVPLGSPVYCIGETYKHGTDVYMSRSLAKDYPTSYFATKPESEVLSAIGTR